MVRFCGFSIKVVYMRSREGFLRQLILRPWSYFFWLCKRRGARRMHRGMLCRDFGAKCWSTAEDRRVWLRKLVGAYEVSDHTFFVNGSRARVRSTHGLNGRGMRRRSSPLQVSLVNGWYFSGRVRACALSIAGPSIESSNSDFKEYIRKIRIYIEFIRKIIIQIPFFFPSNFGPILMCKGSFFFLYVYRSTEKEWKKM